MNKALSFLKSLDWKIWLVIVIVIVLIIVLIAINRSNKGTTTTTSTTVVNQPNQSLSGNDSFPLKYGSRGENVKKWQTYLNTKGAKLSVDGIWGPLTDAASLKHTGFNSITAEYFNSVIK